jgi:hypothetical protein
MNHDGERVEFSGAGLEIAENVRHLILSGIDQYGTRRDKHGLLIGPDVHHVSVWDCSFCDNTHPYDRMPYANTVDYGTGLYAGVIRDGDDRSRIRRYVEISHVRCENNDVDGFQLASTAHGRVQFSEGSYTPDTRRPEKCKDVFQYKHSNGFSTDSGTQVADFASQDNVYLFCYTHHNGQDGWDIAAPYTRLFGCVTHDEAHVGIPFGGVGLKLWQGNCHIAACLSFRNNVYDGSGAAMTLANYVADPVKTPTLPKHAFISSCAFYHAETAALSLGDNLTHVRIENCVFERYGRAMTSDIAATEGSSVRHCIFADDGEQPGFTDPEAGCFFPKPGSLLTTAGDNAGLIFDVDGVDYARYDGLGRPRQSLAEAGPYTRYDGPDIVEDL